MNEILNRLGLGPMLEGVDIGKTMVWGVGFAVVFGTIFAVSSHYDEMNRPSPTQEQVAEHLKPIGQVAVTTPPPAPAAPVEAASVEAEAPAVVEETAPAESEAPAMVEETAPAESEAPAMVEETAEAEAEAPAVLEEAAPAEAEAPAVVEEAAPAEAEAPAVV
ncbi:MAG: hypothetical protein JXM75_12135, partial [Chromatiaceae bacterium]|nr:hypothetical protein [Chromatiaceae bacterium]